MYSVVMSGVCMLQYKCQVWWCRCNPPPAVWVAVSWASNLSAPALGSCVSLCHCLPCLLSSYITCLATHCIITESWVICVRLLLKVLISLSLIHILSCQSLCLHIRNKYVEVALLEAGQQSSSQLRGEGWSVRSIGHILIRYRIQIHECGQICDFIPIFPQEVWLLSEWMVDKMCCVMRLVILLHVVLMTPRYHPPHNGPLWLGPPAGTCTPHITITAINDKWFIVFWNTSISSDNTPHPPIIAQFGDNQRWSAHQQSAHHGTRLMWFHVQENCQCQCLDEDWKNIEHRLE